MSFRLKAHRRFLETCIGVSCMRYLSKSYYDVLNVPQSCTSKDVREAFINLSKKNHPDKHLNDPSMHERFVRINEAYSVLINPTKRRAYDMTLNHRQKLEPPSYSSRPTYYYQSYQQRRPTRNSYENDKQKTHQKNAYSNSSSYSTSENGSGGFSWTWDERSKNKNYSSKPYYFGLEGIKKVSNATIVALIMLFTVFGVALQASVIKKYSTKSREAMLEQSRRNNLIYSLTREKAMLYGNEHQINVLKGTLQSTFDLPNEDRATPTTQPSEPDEPRQSTCRKCKKALRSS